MSAANGLSGRRILVVEDEVIVAWMLEDMPGQLGCAVVGPATRIDRPLAIIGTEDLDAAVLDVNLNGEKSYPVADTLAARGMPFVVLRTSKARLGAVTFATTATSHSERPYPMLRPTFSDRPRCRRSMFRSLTNHGIHQ